MPWHGLTAQLYLKFLLVTQPFTNTSGATKRSSNWTENGKCTNVTNHRSREGLSTPFSARFVLMTRIFTDLIMHNYRSNQSVLMTRFGTDLRHQYGIFGSKSQTSFSWNATRARSEEGRLFSQAIVTCTIIIVVTTQYAMVTTRPWKFMESFYCGSQSFKIAKGYNIKQIIT